MEYKCHAKVNLTLDIYPVEESGYHPIKTIFQKISLCDVLTIKSGPEGSGLTFHCNIPEINDDPHNSIQKTYNLMCSYFDNHWDVYVQLQKNIPLKSGLGGGSSNAATFMMALNEFYNLGLDEIELTAIGAQIGMDVPFFLSNVSTALGERYGDIITPIPQLPSCGIFVCMSDVQVTTANAYQAIDQYPMSMNSELTDEWVDNLKNDELNSVERIRGLAHNDFESYLWEKYPQLLESKKMIEHYAPEYINIDDIHISGSGGALFYLFDLKEKEAWEKIAEDISKKKGYFAYVGDTLMQSQTTHMSSL